MLLEEKKIMSTNSA